VLVHRKRVLFNPTNAEAVLFGTRARRDKMPTTDVPNVTGAIVLSRQPLSGVLAVRPKSS